jgi:hypothetical protein
MLRSWPLISGLPEMSTRVFKSGRPDLKGSHLEALAFAASSG